MPTEYISSSGVLSTSSDGAESVYIRCEPNTQYIIKNQSPETKRKIFRIGYSDEVPTVGTTVSMYANLGNISEIVATTPCNARYLILNYYLKSVCGAINLDDIRKSIFIYKYINFANFTFHYYHLKEFEECRYLWYFVNNESWTNKLKLIKLFWEILPSINLLISIFLFFNKNKTAESLEP